MKTRNNFIADAFGTDRSARNVNNGTSGPAGPIPKAPWRSSGIGNMPPITIDAAQSASAIPAGAAHRHLPDKSCSAPVSRSLLQRRRQLHCRSKNCVKCRNVFFSSFCSSDSAKNQVGADSLSRNYREDIRPCWRASFWLRSGRSGICRLSGTNFPGRLSQCFCFRSSAPLSCSPGSSIAQMAAFFCRCFFTPPLTAWAPV